MSRKTKHLHNITIEGCQFQTRLWYNTNTDHITIGTYHRYRKAYRDSHLMINFLGKKYQINDPIPEGYHRHHFIYDHANPTDNIVVMTIGDHTKMHHLLRKLGYQIPHINVRINDKYGF